MSSVVISLDTVVQDYLNDRAFLKRREMKAGERNETIPYYKNSIIQFANNTYNLEAFREALKRLNKDKFWNMHGTGLLEIHKLILSHLPGNPEVEAHVRFILAGLNAQNVGQSIEQFYKFLSAEKERLEKSAVSPGKIVAPGKSALLISLFAFWNDYTGQPYIYYAPVRLGLAALINAKLIPAPSDIKLESSGVRIISESEHQTVTQTLDSLGMAFPQLKRDPYWTEGFFVWLTDQIKKNPEYLKIPIYMPPGGGDDDDETPESGELPEQSYDLIEDLPLMPTPEPWLSQCIAELRKHILVEESVVRRIYHALLNGHIILTGPPGTGKTELARLLPELLWQREASGEDSDDVNVTASQESARTGYTATLVTATNEWSARTLISSIAPLVNADKVAYRTQHGHLTAAILRNWAFTQHVPAQWEFHGRKLVQARSYATKESERAFQGHWLIIDEFNRAPIDAALGEALTTLSDGEALLVPIDGTHINVPLPKDFRIIGTLNSFDRNYLNKISEALKRRFAFIEILPPSRSQRTEEQGIVLYKAMKKIMHLSRLIHYPVVADDIDIFPDFELNDATLLWLHVILIGPNKAGIYDTGWMGGNPFQKIFLNVLWPLFEVIRIYRRLGTAQAIALVRQVITPMLMLTNFNNKGTEKQWIEALDWALCDTIADQLQVLHPDELDVLIWWLRYDRETFIAKYNSFMAGLVGKPKRLGAHLEAISAVVDKDGQPMLSDEEVEQLLEDADAQLAPELLTDVFHLQKAQVRLPHFSRRLRALKAERSL